MQVTVSSLGDISQHVLIEALPQALVLHLNCVRYDVAAGGITKIRKSIQFAQEAEIPLVTISTFLVAAILIWSFLTCAQRPSEPPHYRLNGVLCHHGGSACSGHYTADVLHPNGDGDTGEVWLHIDNEAVSPMQHEDVFREYGTERANDKRCAYLLFYCRTFQ
jgi:ubiquitin C-terminal hydrolase